MSSKTSKRPQNSKSTRANIQFQKAMATALPKSERMQYESPLGKR